jgi:ubiquinone/menaquinone biosynthesis C-methylase UbiE
MKLNTWERILVNNPARALFQRQFEVPLLLKKGGKVEGKRVLEIGCGRGVGIEILFERFGAGHVTAIDMDPRMVEHARGRLARFGEERLHLAVGVAEAIHFPDASFDAIFDFGIIHHVPTWQTAISEVARVLKPGGLFFFEEVSRKGLERWLYRKLFEHPRTNRFSLEEFVEEIERQGMCVTGDVASVWFGDFFIGVARR